MKERMTLSACEAVDWAKPLWEEMTGLEFVDNECFQEGWQIAFVQMFMQFLERNYIILDDSEETIDFYSETYAKACYAHDVICADICVQGLTIFSDAKMHSCKSRQVS